MENNRYGSLLDSLSELKRGVDDFVSHPSSPQTAPLALQATSIAFYELLKVYTPDKEIYEDTVERFLVETSRIQNQINSLCLIDGKDATIRTVQKYQEAYREKIEVRRDIATRMQEGAHPDELRNILRSVVPEQI